mgnify:CR=1 FL=1
MEKDRREKIEDVTMQELIELGVQSSQSAISPITQIVQELKESHKEQIAVSKMAHERTDEIKIQTTKTNGRVNFLEKMAWTTSGAIGVFSLLESSKILSLFK